MKTIYRKEEEGSKEKNCKYNINLHKVKQKGRKSERKKGTKNKR